MLTAIAEAGGLVALVVVVVALSTGPRTLPPSARYAFFSLVAVLAFNHAANLLELAGHVWADGVADNLSVVVPLLWGLVLVEVGRAYLTSQVSAGESRLAFVLKYVPAPVALVDPLGKVQACSRAWATQIGACTPGQALRDAIPAQARQLRATVEAPLPPDGEAAQGDEQVLTGDGAVRHYRWAVSGYAHPDWAEPGLLLLLQDRTDEVQAEATRRRAMAQLADLQRMGAIAQLAAGAAHDFNNLLQIVEGILVDIEHGEQDPAMISNLRTAATAARAVTGSMLRLGRARPDNVQRVDLDGLVTELQGLLSQALGNRHTLKTESPGRAVFVRAAPGRVQQALLNLVINARDAMPNGGEVAICLEGSGAEARISVADTGMGIAPEVRERLFEPFFTTKGELGTGLGLGVVQSVVRECGGQVEVESAHRTGTTFTLRLPLWQAGNTDPSDSHTGRAR